MKKGLLGALACLQHEVPYSTLYLKLSVHLDFTKAGVYVRINAIFMGATQNREGMNTKQNKKLYILFFFQ